MSVRTIAAVVLIGISATSARGQEYSEIDRQIAHFVEVGYASSWLPFELFKGCPRLADWQDHGFRRLTTMDLSPKRENDLAYSWAVPLRDCRDPRLEQWYLDRFSAAVQRGDWGRMTGLRTALRMADSPGIRAYLWSLAMDETAPDGVRGVAGSLYFVRLTPPESVAEYLRGFREGGLPYNIAWGVAAILMRDGHAQGIMDGMAREVRLNPALANQPAFRQVVQTAHDYADQSTRDRLAAALEAGLAAAPGRVTDVERKHLRSSIAHLRRRSGTK